MAESFTKGGHAAKTGISEYSEGTVMGKTSVGIIMGSKSDLKIMSEAADILASLGVNTEISIISAHRTPERAQKYASLAASRGLKVIIAGAGGAAHLAGVIAASTTLPVIGVPIRSGNSLDGWDSVLSTLQMPPGVPVATVALNGAQNAGILAAQILALGNQKIAKKLGSFKKEMRRKVEESADMLEKIGHKKYIRKLETGDNK